MQNPEIVLEGGAITEFSERDNCSKAVNILQ